MAKDVQSTNDQKSATLSIRLTEQELASLKERANLTGTSLSSFARNLLVNGQLADFSAQATSHSASGYLVGGNISLEWNGQSVVSRSTEPIVRYSSIETE